MYSAVGRFSIAQDREPFLLKWISDNTCLAPMKDLTREFRSKCDRLYHVDYLFTNPKNSKIVGVSMRTISVSSEIHTEHGYGFHLRKSCTKTGAAREFFKNTQKFNPDKLKEKIGVDYILVIQGFFNHSINSEKEPELKGVLVLELTELLSAVHDGHFIDYQMGKYTSHPATFSFVPLSEIYLTLPSIGYSLDIGGEDIVRLPRKPTFTLY
jgi:hypothetical protein